MDKKRCTHETFRKNILSKIPIVIPKKPKKCDPSCEIFGTEHSCGDKCQKQSTI